MRTEDGRLEVERIMSLNFGKHNAYWNIKEDFGKITFYLPNLWGNASNHSLFFEHDYPDKCFNNFIEELVFADLTERVCLERAHEKIRMKGRTRCKPNCCIHRAVLCMYNHQPWDYIRKTHPINQEDPW